MTLPKMSLYPEGATETMQRARVAEILSNFTDFSPMAGAASSGGSALGAGSSSASLGGLSMSLLPPQELGVLSMSFSEALLEKASNVHALSPPFEGTASYAQSTNILPKFLHDKEAEAHREILGLGMMLEQQYAAIHHAAQQVGLQLPLSLPVHSRIKVTLEDLLQAHSANCHAVLEALRSAMVPYRRKRDHPAGSKAILEKWYNENRDEQGNAYLKTGEKEALAALCRLKPRQIVTWVSNRRNRKDELKGVEDI